MEFLKKLLFPHISVLVLLVPIAAVMLIYTFTFSEADGITAYISYFLSAYALTIVCARVPEIYRKAKTVKKENKYVNRYFSDAHLRIKISLYSSVAMNTVYAVIQLISGFYYRSVWFYSLFGYYTLLAVIRFFLLRDTLSSKTRLNELYRYRFCGIMLLLMNQALAVIVFYIVRQNRGFEYHYIHTIALAAYTFALTIKAVINIFKYRRFNSPVMSAAKAISLASALVSMLSLETAMISAFDETNSPAFRQTMTAMTGAAVCVFVLAMAIYMIIKSTKEIKYERKRNF